MNRIIITIFLTFSISFCFGQYNHDFRVAGKDPRLDKLHNSFEKVVISEEIDSLFLNRNSLIDGEKTIYWDNQKTTPHFRFETLNGNINGSFYCYNVNGILTTVGNYSNDSLWTFRNGYFLLHDTTFKSGYWRYYSLQDPFDSTYYSAFTMDREYKIPYDSLGDFNQEWSYPNGQIWEKRLFTMGLGLINEVVFNIDGSKYSDFEKLKNCTISRKWDKKGNLKWITINNKMEYWITMRRGEDDKYFHYKLNDPENKREELTNPKGENFQSRLFYPNGHLMEFYDRKAGITILYDEHGEVLRIEKRKGTKIKKE